jgi:hypothetical protein
LVPGKCEAIFALSATSDLCRVFGGKRKSRLVIGTAEFFQRKEIVKSFNKRAD